MGAGYNTEFGNTNGSNSNPRFTRVNFVGSVKVNVIPEMSAEEYIREMT